MRPLFLLAALCLAASALPASAGNGHCPPGLAKKSPACIPPGQAKKYQRGPRVGDRVSDYPYHLIRYPDRYDLPPLRRGERYYVIDGQILRVDQDSYRILDFIRATAALID